jgi:hypothetical protein
MANRFVVDLSGVKLSKETSRLIEDRIQKSVLETIAELREPGDLALRFPREWIGILLHPDFGKLDELDQKIGEQFQF